MEAGFFLLEAFVFFFFTFFFPVSGLAVILFLFLPYEDAGRAFFFFPPGFFPLFFVAAGGLQNLRGSFSLISGEEDYHQPSSPSSE